MKKIIIISLAAIILQGCEKCATCTQTTTISTIPTQKSTVTYDACGDALDYALSNNRNITTYTSSGRIITSIRTSCKYY